MSYNKGIIIKVRKKNFFFYLEKSLKKTIFSQIKIYKFLLCNNNNNKNNNNNNNNNNIIWYFTFLYNIYLKDNYKAREKI